MVENRCRHRAESRNGYFARSGLDLRLCHAFSHDGPVAGENHRRAGGRHSGQRGSSGKPSRAVWRVTHAVCRVAPRLPWSCTCLVNALGAHLMLRRRGIRSVVRLGARIEDGKLQAHAWLLAGGETVLGGKIDQDFAPLAQIERSLASEIPPKQSQRG